MACVYSNEVKPPVDFGLPKDTTYLALLRSKLNNMLLDTEKKRVSEIEFLAPWVNIGGRVKYDCIELETDEDLKVMWVIYHHRLTKGPIEFGVIISRSIDDIIKMLKCP